LEILKERGLVGLSVSVLLLAAGQGFFETGAAVIVPESSICTCKFTRVVLVCVFLGRGEEEGRQICT
jgi:hypothetical protein